MKVIVTGATGQAGKGIVANCLADPRITKVVILTRRAVSMDIESHPKAEVVMHQDYSRYSDELMKRLEGASACLWAIGGNVDQFQGDRELLQKVMTEFPLAAARAMCDRIADKALSAGTGAKFRFVFCSNKNVDRPSHHHKALSFLGDPRRHKTDAERGLIELANTNSGIFDVCILRPNALTDQPAEQPKKKRLGGLSSGSSSGSSAGVSAAQLARAAVKVACEGYKDRFIENDALLKI